MGIRNGILEIKKLGDISVVLRGASPRPIKNYITNNINGVSWIKIGDTTVNSKYIFETKEKITLEGSKKSRYLKKGDLILSNSMSYGRAYILKIDAAIHDGWATINSYERTLNTEFLYYYLTLDKVKKYWEMRMNTGSVSNLNSEIIKSLQIPTPPLPIQHFLVRILDKFDKLTNDISGLLPYEIELREKQYEYHRDKLLAFRKA